METFLLGVNRGHSCQFPLILEYRLWPNFTINPQQRDGHCHGAILVKIKGETTNRGFGNVSIVPPFSPLNCSTHLSHTHPTLTNMYNFQKYWMDVTGKCES